MTALAAAWFSPPPKPAGEICGLIPDKHVKAILAVFLIALLPHLGRLPWWTPWWCAAAWGYLLVSGRRKRPRLSRRWRGLLTLVGLGAVILSFDHPLQLEAGVAAVAVLLGLKPLETSSHRDRMISLIMAYFLILANLFMDQSLGAGLYLLAAVLITQAVFIHINSSMAGPSGSLKLSARIMLQAAPVMLVLFLVFPRLPFGLGLSSPLARTGLSDTLSPGAITRLVTSRAVAFRVRFHLRPPERDHLYWRTLVLWHFDGDAWHTDPGVPPAFYPPRLTGQSGQFFVNYSLFMEPHGRRWLPVLDLPRIAPPGAYMLADYTLRTVYHLDAPAQYEMTSAFQARTGRLYRWELAALALPAGNPRARSLARSWRRQSDSPPQIVKLALDYIRSQDFIYTLNPPPLPTDNSVDHFLFVTRKGFCEHYASAMAFLLRAAGIPARIVIGYQGGEMNPLSDYFVVRASDAHAWIEAWLPGSGWVRVDPTRAVAPARIRQGVNAALSSGETVGFLSNRGHPFYPYWSKISWAWDSLNYKWSIYVLDYGPSEQFRLLSELGLKIRTWSANLAVFILSAALAVLGLIFLFLHFHRRRPPRAGDPIQRAYLLFCHKMSLQTLPRHPSQGPLDYARMIIRARPDLKTPVLEISQLYIQLRYGREKDDRLIKLFKQRVKRFRPGRWKVVKSSFEV